MLIQPDSYIRLIKNCPLDNSYKDTIYFENHEEQANYFKNTLQGIPFTKQSYQRYDKGVLHIQEKADNLYGCNYLMFQNTAFGNKWFYAFINSIEYVNNVSSKVYYEIDVLQTWLGGENNDYDIQPCYVVREHSSTDKIGDNLIPEDISVSDYVCANEIHAIPSDELSLVIQYVGELPGGVLELITENPPIIGEGVYGGIYQDSNFLILKITLENKALINEIIGALNILTFGGLINVFMIPTIFADEYLKYKDNPNIISDVIGFGVSRPTTIDGYTPKNYKLYTYPYVVASLTNGCDADNDYAFERFENGIATFNAVCPLNSSARVLAYPIGYDGMNHPTNIGVSSITMQQCGYAGEKFINWFSNNSLTMIAGALTGAQLFGANSNTANPSNGLVPYNVGDATRNSNNQAPITIDSNAIMAGVATISAFAQHSGLRSNAHSPSLYAVPESGIITAKAKTIRNYSAKCIDSFFTMFGYAVKSIKIPNRNVRETFTYVQTNGFSGHGNVPADAMRKIRDIHDKGVTYWNKNKVIGDYSQSNNPL